MIQIDIPMPENCVECPCYGLIMFENGCNITGHKFTHNMFDGRAEDCPLKDQEPKAPSIMQDADGIWAMCPTCGNKLRAILAMEMDTYFPKHCQECGQAVKWK